MVTIPPERVAETLHTDLADLPTGFAEDIMAAEHVIETHVEPHASPGQGNAVETTGVLVAAAFIGGTDGEAPVARNDRESTSHTFDVQNMSPEARDHWARALMIDPTGQLRAATQDGTPFELEAVGGRGRTRHELERDDRWL